jgi:hypothetical protein
MLAFTGWHQQGQTPARDRPAIGAHARWSAAAQGGR